MKAARRQKIRELLNTKPYVSLKELTDMFPDVTSMTLRRDIEYFEQQGELIKVRNGARSMRFIAATADEKYSRREKENEEAKKSLAIRAVAFIEPGRCYFFDSGSTVMQLADALPDENMAIVTPSPHVSLKLIDEKKKPIVHLIGGILNRDSLSVTGDQSIACMKDFTIDTAFIVPSGYSAEGGFSCGNYSECELKRFVVKNARRVIMLIDSSKFDKTLPYNFCELPDIDMLITDSENPLLTERAQNCGVSVILADKPAARDHVTRCLPSMP